ncbi:hypothetical protein MUK42_35493 [Musa troglodytarum]|uniref:Uncharacterized protein n=1 Tax=Musa troglodytarum TaxID=320322 RepID=A0A9E7K9V7_9LILI|nr:hypothetical protein MUK42_35493 [Musa troglodytarum]
MADSTSLPSKHEAYIRGQNGSSCPPSTHKSQTQLDHPMAALRDLGISFRDYSRSCRHVAFSKRALKLDAEAREFAISIFFLWSHLFDGKDPIWVRMMILTINRF